MLCKALQDDGNDDGDDDKLGVCIIHDMHSSVGKGGTAPYYISVSYTHLTLPTIYSV